MLKRRKFLTMAALAGLGLPAERAQAVPSAHPLFATSRLPGASWTPYSMSRLDRFDSTAYIGITDPALRAEAEQWAKMNAIAEIETDWLNLLRSDKPLIACNVHYYTGYIDTILDEALFLPFNTVIVGVIGLSMLLATSCGRFVRNSNEDSIPALFTRTKASWLYPSVGRIDHLNVMCDASCADQQPTLIGYIPPNPAERKVAMVQTGVADFEFGILPGHDHDWTTIGMNGINCYNM